MQYRLVKTFWTAADDLCGCDVELLDEPVSPTSFLGAEYFAPSVAVHVIVSLETMPDAALLWIAGFEVVNNGEKR